MLINSSRSKENQTGNFGQGKRSDSNEIQPFSKTGLAKWLSVCLGTKLFRIRIPLLLLKL